MGKNVLALALLGAAVACAQTPAQGAFADLPGLKLWYIDTGGHGVPVVFLHATTGTSASWENQLRPFTAAGYRVIAFDRRGWGRTEVDREAQRADTAADDLAKLLDYLKIDRVHLVGTAAGGFVAIDFAISFPNRLRSLVLAHTIGGMTDPEYLELGRRLRPSQFDALPAELRELGPAYRAADKEGTLRWVALESKSRPPGTVAQPTKNRLTFAALEKIQTPTLLISGGADMYAPPAVMQLIGSHIHNSKLVNIPDAGHSGFWEAPEKFNGDILRFIRKR